MSRLLPLHCSLFTLNMTTYLLINLLTVAIPLAASFDKRVAYAREWRRVVPAMGLSAVFFLVWDVVFTRLGVWGFSPEYLLGLSWFGLPVEEILFFFCIPFSCVFIYEVARWRHPAAGTSPGVRRWMAGLAVVCGILSVAAWPRAYTVTVSVALGLFITWHLCRGQAGYLDNFHRSFAWTIPPFLIVNGVLTRGLAAVAAGPVVWYNDVQNLGLRVFTIPVEDFLYCYLLILMNVTFLEYFRRTA